MLFIKQKCKRKGGKNPVPASKIRSIVSIFLVYILVN